MLRECVLSANAVSADVPVLMREGCRGRLKLPVMFLPRVLCSCLCICVCVCVQRSEKSRMSAHLKALGADFLAFLHPGDSGFGLPGGLAHKRRDSARDARLVLWGFDETWHAWGRARAKRDREKGGGE